MILGTNAYITMAVAALVFIGVTVGLVFLVRRIIRESRKKK